MIPGFYSAAGGMQATSLQQDVTAHNLNHAMKPGYQRQVLRFSASGPDELLTSPEGSLFTDFSPGTLEFTGNPLDLTLNGPGFFQVQGPNGPLYTRSGNFQLNGQGQLVTMEGRAVLGNSGPISIPVGTMSIEVLDNASVVADGNELDQLKVITFRDPDSLIRVGTSSFEASPNMATVDDGPEVRQGYREAGNTTVVSEMVQMISGLRQFEAAQRALRTLGDAVGLATRPTK